MWATSPGTLRPIALEQYKRAQVLIAMRFLNDFVKEKLRWKKSHPILLNDLYVMETLTNLQYHTQNKQLGF